VVVVGASDRCAGRGRGAGDDVDGASALSTWSWRDRAGDVRGRRVRGHVSALLQTDSQVATTSD